jgi:hypothetical protein
VREDRDVAEIPLPQKFKHAVERGFLQPLRDFGTIKERKAAAKKALTFWLQGKAAEFWAV